MLCVSHPAITELQSIFSPLLFSKQKKILLLLNSCFQINLRSMLQELCFCMWVSIASLSASADVYSSVFQSIKYSIEGLSISSSLTLALLPICFSPYPCLRIVAFPVSLIPVLLQIHLSVALSVCVALFPTRLWLSRRCRSTPAFPTPSCHPFTLSFFLSWFPPPPPTTLSASVPLVSVVIKSDSSLGENNKHLLNGCLTSLWSFTQILPPFVMGINKRLNLF